MDELAAAKKQIEVLELLAALKDDITSLAEFHNTLTRRSSALSTLLKEYQALVNYQNQQLEQYGADDERLSGDLEAKARELLGEEQ